MLPLRWLRRTALTALVYSAAGLGALMLAGPPAYAAPLFPAAGVALAAAIAWGQPGVVGTLVGAFIVNSSLGALRGQDGAALVALPLVIALGAAAQAALGGWLVRRQAGMPVLLDEPRPIARAGLLGACVACMVSPSIATAALLASGAIAREGAAGNWITWWAGDTLGALIAAPLLLSFIGEPAEIWRPRRRGLVVPLTAALMLLAGAMWAVAERERSSNETVFQRRADSLAAGAQQRLLLPVHALQALHAAERASGRADLSTLRATAAWWLAAPSPLQALGYSERVAVADIPAFEAAARAEGLRDFRVFQRDGGRALSGDGEAVVLRRIEPEAGNAAALGVNALSIPAARQAIEAARRTGGMAATAGFRLSQSAHDETGVVIYQALLGEPAGPVADGFRGVLFVTVRTESLMRDLVGPGAVRDGEGWCLFDRGIGSARGLLAGVTACAGLDTTREERFARRQVHLADRPLDLMLLRPAADTAHGPALHWLLTVAGLAASAVLGAWLLTVTGNTLRTQRAIDAATTDLQREVAERRQAEQERASSEARLRTILDSAPLGIAFLDPHGKLLHGNPRLFEMLGRPPEMLLGQTVASVTLPEDLPAALRDHHDLLAGRVEVIRRPLRLQCGDGHPLNVRMACTALRLEGGRVQYMVAVLEDLSEHLQLEEAERARQRAEASSRAKSEFVSRMSHELRTPLNAMLGFAQLLGLDRQAPLPDHQRQWVQQIQRAGWHLLELVNDTLDLARIESGSVRLDLQALDLAPVIEGCVELVRPAAAARGVALKVAVPPGLPPVTADATRLKQVITNLLSNAVKYNHESGHVELLVSALAPARVSRRAAPGESPAGARQARGSPVDAGDAGRVQLRVTDTGLGMTAEQLQRLFEPYNRLGREGSGVEGTGIGLVIARRLAEMMGGTLQAESRAGAGSTFTLELQAAAAAAAPAEGALPLTVAPYRSRRVLYIEDNATNVEVMRGILLQRPQIHLDVATLGREGLALARRLRPDLILLDMQLPDFGGAELLRLLAADDDTAAIPVIVVSADATPARIEEALTLGALHYVTKPVALRPFLDRLDEVLNATETKFG